MAADTPVTYLSVENFWKYQNADVWKKSKIHPPWFKHYVHRDRELDQLPYPARLLFWELVGAATRYSNVLEADLNWIYAETRVDVETIRETLPLLLKGGWLSETRGRRRSRKPSRENLEDHRDQDVEVEVDIEPPKPPKRVQPQNQTWHDCPIAGCSRMSRTRADLETHIETDHEWNVTHISEVIA